MAQYFTVRELQDTAHTESNEERLSNRVIRVLPEILEAHPELKINPQLKLSSELKMEYPQIEKYCGRSTLVPPDDSSNSLKASSVMPLRDTISSANMPAGLPENIDKILHSKPLVVKPLGQAIKESSNNLIGDLLQIRASSAEIAKQIAKPQNGDSSCHTAKAIDHQSTIEYEIDAPTAALIEKWQGTSVLRQPDWLIAGSKSTLEQLIIQQSIFERDIRRSPYDPECWMLLTQVYHALCYPDLQVSTSYRALLLVTQGFNLNDRSLGREVRCAIAKRLSCNSVIVVTCELNYQRLEAFKGLLYGLRDLGAYFDGMAEAKRALQFYPEDSLILDIYKYMKGAFKSKQKTLQKSELKPEEVRFLSRSGRTRKRRYPWLQEEFFHRTPTLLAEINSQIKSSNCEVRQVNLGRQLSELHRTDDVGPLGVFAKCDIKKDEVVLIDDNISFVSGIHPSAMIHCDSCQASLSPLVNISEPVVALCCKGASYCSEKCRDSAVNGYHKVLCSQDFTWIYKSITSDGEDPSWRTLVLLRIFAIIVADQQISPKNKKMHPLKHPILARLTEGYALSASTDDSEHGWSYTSNVVAPTKILLQLGVDIFTCLEWSPEVLHTIYWREVNNACRATSITIKDDKIYPNPLSGISPNYVLFNHSCDANVNWMAAGGGPGVTILGQMGMPTKVGCNSLLCTAARDIKRGEECRISYVPLRDRKQLRRWFEGGCGCAFCETDGGTTPDDSHDEFDPIK